jgi:hypothetical protein
MSQILNANEIKEFNKNGAILLKSKFDKKWIEKLKVGINKAKANPSPRFTNHTKDKNLPSYLEDFWTWIYTRNSQILSTIPQLQKLLQSY